MTCMCLRVCVLTSALQHSNTIVSASLRFKHVLRAAPAERGSITHHKKNYRKRKSLKERNIVLKKAAKDTCKVMMRVLKVLCGHVKWADITVHMYN